MLLVIQQLLEDKPRWDTLDRCVKLALSYPEHQRYFLDEGLKKGEIAGMDRPGGLGQVVIFRTGNGPYCIRPVNGQDVYVLDSWVWARAIQLHLLEITWRGFGIVIPLMHE